MRWATSEHWAAQVHIFDEHKEILESFLFCMTLGLLPCLPLHKAKWVQLNGKTLQVLKNSLEKVALDSGA